MAKPILVIRFPYDRHIDELVNATKNLEKKMDDYHILSFMDSCTDRVKFECFNSPHTEIEFEELKRHVLELIKP